LTKRGGLRAKMVAWVLVPTTLVLAAVGGMAFYTSQRVTEDLVLERNRNRTQLLANQLSADLEAYELPLGSVALEGTVQPLYDLQDILNREWPGGDLAVFDAGVMVLDSEGSAVAAVPDWANLYGKRFADLVAERTMSQPEDLPLTDILIDKIADRDVIAFSRPIEDTTGEIWGTAVGLFQAERGATRTSHFYRSIWNLYIGRRETAYLVDGHGRVIFHPDTFFIGEDFSHVAAVQRVLHGEGGAVRSRDVEGREVVAGFAPVPRTSWGLVTEDRWSEITRTSRPYNRFMVGLLTLGVVVPVVVVALGVRRITRPVAELTRAAEEVAGGNFGQSIEVRTGDELEMLAEQFNVMAKELQASYAHLEQRVADRTRELSTLNAVSAVVSRSLELEQVMGAALRKTLQTMEMEAGAAFRLEGAETLRLMAHQGLSDPFVREVREMPLRRSLASQAVDEVGPVVRSVDDYAEGRLKSALREEGFQSVISVPLVAKNAVLGVLNLATRGPRTITAGERSLLASVGQQAGMAVENARLYEQAEMAAAAAERNRLARELHDAVSQTLFSASLIADVLPRLWERDPEEGRRRLGDLRRLTRGAMAEMRTLLWELRPSALLDTNLIELLDQLSKAVAGRTDIEVVLEVEQAISPPTDVKITLYRIAQEALNNVVKHAGASQVLISAHAGEEGGVVLRIRDDGRGFAPGDVPPGHLGLSTMGERAEGIGAALVVESGPGRGTEVTVVWKGGTADERA
jgi:nitrate/nitrite-specific signal transduction histidine kinase